MNQKMAFALFVLAIVACGERSQHSQDDVVLATASANPLSAFASAAEHALEPAPLLQDTARTVTRRIWADAELYDISPDGRFAAQTDWSGTGNLAIRDIETGEVRHVTHNSAPYEPGYAEGAKFSRDGKWVAYNWYDYAQPHYKLGVVDVEGRDPRLIYRDRDTKWIAQPDDWSPDAQWILASRSVEGRTEMLLISARDGSARLLRTFDDPSSPGSMSFSPDGRHIAYDYAADDSQNRDIYVVNVATGEEHTLVQHPAYDYLMGWAPDGDHVLFGSDRSGTPGAWLLPVTDGNANGNPWLVKPDMWRTVGVGFAQDGRYFYKVDTGRRDVYVLTFDPETRTVIGSPTAVTARSLGNSSHAHWSPDGRHLAYLVERAHAAHPIVAIRSLETGEVRELDLGAAGVPWWTSDGRSLFVRARDRNEPDAILYRVDVQTGSKQVVLRGDDATLGQPSPDGRLVFYSIITEDPDGQAVSRVLRRELATGDTTTLFEAPYRLAVEISGRLSPDGRTLAFSYSPPEGPRRLVLLPVTGEEPRELPLTDIDSSGSARMAWMPDGQALLLWRHPEVWYVDLADGDAQRIGLSIPGGQPGISLDVHPDGRRIAYMSGTRGAELWVMENFLPTDASGR